MNNHIICRFCKNPAQHKPLKEAQIVNIEVYFCYKCQAEYSTFCGKQNIYYSLYAFIGDRLYKWGLGGVTSYLSYIGLPGEPGVRINAETKLIGSFDSDLTITPQNINDKTKTILTFL